MATVNSTTNPDDINGRLAVVLPSLRRERNLTKSELARLIGCSRQFISQIESGQRKPSREMSRKLARALRVTFDALEG